MDKMIMKIAPDAPRCSHGAITTAPELQPLQTVYGKTISTSAPEHQTAPDDSEKIISKPCSNAPCRSRPFYQNYVPLSKGAPLVQQQSMEHFLSSAPYAPYAPFLYIIIRKIRDAYIGLKGVYTHARVRMEQQENQEFLCRQIDDNKSVR